ncbi:nucleoside phosphorylase [bacterium]|nr:nucleoside phosphorylase [bacterium]
MPESLALAVFTRYRVLMNQRDYPILEFDSTRPAIIEPSEQIKPCDVPEHCVPCFFREVIDELVESGRARETACMKSEMGRHPVYELDVEGKRLAVFQPGITSAFAGAMLEETIAFGCRKFIACGSAGVLDREITFGHVVIPESAVRDDGLSYHYVPPSREVAAHPEGIAALKTACDKHNIPYLIGKTWTTDGFYRETPQKVELRCRNGSRRVLCGRGVSWSGLRTDTLRRR